MSRRKTETEGGVPLYLIPQVILRWIQAVGDELEWIRVRWSNHHFFTVRVRTRPVKREYGRAAASLEAV